MAPHTRIHVPVNAWKDGISWLVYLGRGSQAMYNAALVFVVR